MKKDKWKDVTREGLVDVKVGTKIRNKQGETFRVVRVCGLNETGDTLKVECVPLSKPPQHVSWDGENWAFAPRPE